MVYNYQSFSIHALCRSMIGVPMALSLGAFLLVLSCGQCPDYVIKAVITFNYNITIQLWVEQGVVCMWMGTCLVKFL